MFKCGDGRCVKPDKICDGKFDCIDAADERDCGKPIFHNCSQSSASLTYPDLFQICVLPPSGDVRVASVLTRPGGVTEPETAMTAQTSWTAPPSAPACP